MDGPRIFIFFHSEVLVVHFYAVDSSMTTTNGKGRVFTAAMTTLKVKQHFRAKLFDT